MLPGAQLNALDRQRLGRAGGEHAVLLVQPGTDRAHLVSGRRNDPRDVDALASGLFGDGYRSLYLAAAQLRVQRDRPVDAGVGCEGDDQWRRLRLSHVRDPSEYVVVDQK